MAHLNYTFFDEFKRLDRLCGEIYDAKQGVTAYIEDMKTVTLAEYSRVPAFREDLEKLKRVRHIRNQLAHDTGSFAEPLSTQADIDFVRSFYLRIMDSKDPMAQVRKTKTQAPKRPYTPPPAQPHTPLSTLGEANLGSSRKRKSGCGLFIAVLVFMALVLFALSYRAFHG